MTLLKPGTVKTESFKGQGQLLLTDQTLYAFRVDVGAAQTGAAVGGLVGALIGHWLDSRKLRKMSPEHLNDPEIRMLEPSLQKALRGSTLLVMIPLKDLTVVKTGMGFRFRAPGRPEFTYSNLFHKGKIFNFLDERHIPFEDA